MTTAKQGGSNGLGLDIPRRDVSAQGLGAAWTGYGGVGDYRRSNGHTAGVVEAAHRIRDQLYEGALTGVTDAGDADLVVVGGGFCGLGAMLAFAQARSDGTCLLLDNQEVFGGFAKANEFDVDGYRVSAAQASMNFVQPGTPAERIGGYWPELGLPDAFRFVERSGGDPSIVFQRSASGALYHGEQSATVGYHFDGPGGGWVKDIWSDDLARAPWPRDRRREFLALRELKRRGKPGDAEAQRLDAMTFADYAARELYVGPEAQRYVTLGMCQTGPQVSALAALTLPGVDRYAADSAQAETGGRFVSFPDGNATLAKLFVKSMLPAAIDGKPDWESVALGGVRPLELDRPTERLRIRQGALAVRVEHGRGPGGRDGVAVTYVRRGRLVRLRAKAAVMTTGAWVTKHVVAGLPPARRAALDAHLYAPMLIVNVALRNWRFLDRLGFSAARWFEGFGFYASIRQPMQVGERPTPFHPDKPIVLTMYVPFPNPDLPLAQQGSAGRAQLFSTPFYDYERQVIAQLTHLFTPGGFDSRRDVAGIVLNRWGHAFLTAGPGFRFGIGGQPAPSKMALAPWGRIAFGQSADWLGSARSGARAVREVASFL